MTWTSVICLRSSWSETTLSVKSVLTLLKELCNLDVHKACGPDSIPSKFVRFAADVIASTITKIFNKSLETATYPDDW